MLKNLLHCCIITFLELRTCLLITAKFLKWHQDDRNVIYNSSKTVRDLSTSSIRSQSTWSTRTIYTSPVSPFPSAAKHHVGVLNKNEWNVFIPLTKFIGGSMCAADLFAGSWKMIVRRLCPYSTVKLCCMPRYLGHWSIRPLTCRFISDYCTGECTWDSASKVARFECWAWLKTNRQSSLKNKYTTNRFFTKYKEIKCDTRAVLKLNLHLFSTVF